VGAQAGPRGASWGGAAEGRVLPEAETRNTLNEQATQAEAAQTGSIRIDRQPSSVTGFGNIVEFQKTLRMHTLETGPYIGQRKWRDHTRPPKIKGPPNQYLVIRATPTVYQTGLLFLIFLAKGEKSSSNS
jgi:hypothetical protein